MVYLEIAAKNNPTVQQKFHRILGKVFCKKCHKLGGLPIRS